MSLERVEECPLCKQKNFKSLLTCKDYTTTGETFHVEQCGGCGFVITNPRPSASDAPRYYQSEDYISHSGKSRGLIDSIYLIVRSLTVKWKFRLVNSYRKGNSLLDIGCGTGHFSSYCQSKGLSVIGTEPSAAARKIASESIPVFESLNQVSGTFDVVTLWHVLEHIYDFTDTIGKIKSQLSDRGTIFIAVPNYESYDAKHYKEQWAAYDVPRHLWHFSKDTMTQLIQRSGLKLKQIIPMKLDSYYVSMLSEKYKSGGNQTLTGMVRALWFGLSSNLKAGKDNYSSLIYIVQK